ncbi:hypothetical protein ADIARSV_4057 [Arcticibacter svalbardensis MN12-7]|uniref:EAL domain-containing protein n=1 Tax=Arcticibacter svalbardensis MN12-7 TaxID=1150600 RepID=R9GMM0_9SPHI|nr:hypothetical protein ADIARSV_4057 [Arcticibacter svalbardensis MN12-7]
MIVIENMITTIGNQLAFNDFFFIFGSLSFLSAKFALDVSVLD